MSVGRGRTPLEAMAFKKKNAKPHSCLASPVPLDRAKRGSEAATRPPWEGGAVRVYESVWDGV